MRWHKSFSEKIRRLKERTGAELAHVLAGASLSFSEAALAREWGARLDGDETLFDGGWYDPPPDGVIVLCGKRHDGFARIGMPSFRPQKMWPQDNIRYEEGDILTAYASPVCRQTNLIGDFGLSLYRGKDAAIREHFEDVLIASLEIAGFARPGMTFSELYSRAMTHIADKGYTNAIESSTDQAGTNIGHTIPLSFSTDPAWAEVCNVQDFSCLRSVLSAGRIFVSGQEKRVIEPDMAFTIEPRLSAPGLPRIFYHLTVVVEGGEARICHGFTPVLEAFGMERLSRFLGAAR